MKLALALLALAACGSKASSGPPLAPDNVVELKVTERGFEPSKVRVKAGQPVKLIITRVTDATCATDIVVKEHGIKQALPRDQAVTVAFTPTKTGTLMYGCAMDQMINGMLLVE